MEENYDATMGTTGTSGNVEGEKKGTPKEVKNAFKAGGPEEVKESVKKLVEKGVAAVAGALKGIADRAEQEDLKGSAARSVKQIGETTKEVTKEGQKQVDNMKEEFGKGKQGGSSGTLGSSGMGTSDIGTSGSTGIGGTTGSTYSGSRNIDSMSTPSSTTSTEVGGTSGMGSSPMGVGGTGTTGTTGTSRYGPSDTQSKDLSESGTRENKLKGTRERR